MSTARRSNYFRFGVRAGVGQLRCLKDVVRTIQPRIARYELTAMSLTKSCVLAAAVLVSSGCASRGRYSPESDPVAIAAVRAELRVVGSETTWVTRGKGYELIGRSKADLVALQSSLDREAA